MPLPRDCRWVWLERMAPGEEVVGFVDELFIIFNEIIALDEPLTSYLDHRVDAIAGLRPAC